MFSKEKHPARKLAILGLLTALLIGFSAALSWESPTPSNGATVKGDLDINFSDSDSDSSGDYLVHYRKQGNSGWNDATPSSVSDSGSEISFTWDASGLNGDYTLNITDGGDYTNSLTRNFTLDNNAPKVGSFSPTDGGYTNNDDDLDVTYSASDSESSIAYNNVSIFSENISKTATSINDLSLSDGSYTVNYYVVDQVGNWANSSWTFTVDTTKDFSVSPDFDSGPGAVLWSDDFTLDFSIESNSESSDVTVTCLDSEDDTIDTDTLSDGAVSASCDIGDEYSDSTVDISVKVCDRAGNCATSDAETFTFDASSPTIIEASIPGSVVNSDFPVEFTASDASGITGLEYFYDDSTVNEGSGSQVQLNGSEDEFMASVTSLSEGEHTLYFRVRDRAGRWSPADSLNIDYRPDANPEITMEAPSSLTVTAGDSTGFQVRVRNTGNIFIMESEITASASSVFSQTRTVKELEPSNSTTVSFSINTTEDDLGKYDLQLSASNPKTSKTIELLVEATQQQRNSLDSRLADYESKLQQLQQKVDNKRGDLPDDLESRLDSNFSAFKQRVENARTAKQNGNYYKVSSALEGIDSDYQSAQSSFKEVKKEDNRRDMRRWMMIGGGLLLLVLLAGGAFYYFESDELDLDLDLEGLTSGGFDLGSVKQKLSSLVESGEEEAEQFEWDGFKD